MKTITTTNNYFQDQATYIKAAKLPAHTKFKKADLYDEIATWNAMTADEAEELAQVQADLNAAMPSNVAEIAESNSYDELFANWEQAKTEKAVKTKAVKAEAPWTVEDLAIASTLKGRKDRPERAMKVLRLVTVYGVSAVSFHTGYSTSHIRREARAREIYNASNIISTLHKAGNLSWAKIDDYLATKPKLSIEQLEQIAIDLVNPAQESRSK